MQKMLFLTLHFLFLLVLPSYADSEAEVLVLIPDEEIVASSAFSKELEAGGARILELYAPNIFRGYLPDDLQKKLISKYEAKIYTERVKYMADFAPYGSNGMLAAAKWNKHIQEEPDDAPLIINMTVKKSGRNGRFIKLCWNHVPDAIAYKLQTSADTAFNKVYFETITHKSCYSIMPVFWPDGVQYWRVAPSFKTVRKEPLKDGAYSKASTFAVSKNLKEKNYKIASPKLPKEINASKVISWTPNKQPYYRIQISEVNNFNVPVADVFSDTCSYRTSELPLKHGERYYMRIMSSDGIKMSAWSAAALLKYSGISHVKPKKIKYKNND